MGECAEHAGACYGLVEPIYDMAAVAARTLLGEQTSFRSAAIGTHLKVTGVNVFSAGDFLGAPGTESVILSDLGLRTYKKLVIQEDRLVGAVLFGDTADSLWYQELIRTSAPIEAMRDDIVFGRALAERSTTKKAA